jgi:pimeloyl-ACP methyl ester carboxylesterase
MTADEPRTPERLLPAPAEGREERVDLDGWDAHILRWGATSTRRVLLLHGFTSHAHSWQHLASALVSGTGYEVAALDQRGHGRSGATDRYGGRVLVEDVRSLLDALGWERASVAGHSMGGAAAFMFAARYPARVNRLVVIDAGPEVAAEGGARIRANVGRPDVFASIDDALADTRVWFPHADKELLRHRVQHNLVPTADGKLTWRTVSAPTLLVHGADSDVLTYPLVQDLRNARPDIEVADIDGAGHAIPLDQPGPLAAAVARFLASPERS